MSNLESEYKVLLKEALNGVLRADRTGVGCTSVFSKNLKWNLQEEFPLITSKRMYQKIFRTELQWFLNGETNTKRFQDNGVTIWDDWADANGDLGPVYGHQLRNFNSQGIDQLTQVIDSIRNNPDSRRHIVSLWNPIQLEDMALPPCYHNFQFFVENDKLNLHVLQRSGDLFLGIPYDIALFSELLLYVSEITGKKANEVSLTIIDAHIYTNHLKQVKDYINNPQYDFPTYNYQNGELKLFNYKCEKALKAPIAV